MFRFGGQIGVEIALVTQGNTDRVRSVAVHVDRYVEASLDVAEEPKHSWFLIDLRCSDLCNEYFTRK